jgi:intein-encoded DNA endonuclease-like protein
VQSGEGGKRVSSDVIRPATIEGNGDLELPYVLGVLKGDASAPNRKCKGHYFVALQTKDQDFAEAFAQAFSQVLYDQVIVKPLERETNRGYFKGFEVTKGCKEFFLWFKGLSNEGVFALIEGTGSGGVAAFLRGFANSEGSPQKCTVSLRLYNCDVGLLKEIQRLLFQYFKITSTIVDHYSHTRPFLNIQRVQNLQLFLTRIGFSIKRKRERLAWHASKESRPWMYGNRRCGRG